LYQFTDAELVEIENKAEDTGSKIVALSYHGAKMFSDALRFMQHKKTGSFMPVTSFAGVESAKAVLAEDAEFPASKAELIQKQGWKVIDVKQNQTAHLSDYLSVIPERSYVNLNEVVKELEAIIG
jgi:hypothetical protein